MAELLERWCKALQWRFEHWDREALLNEPVRIGKVSKAFTGRFHGDRLKQYFHEPECVTEKQVFDQFECALEATPSDSDWSRDHLIGKLCGSIVGMHETDNSRHGLHSAKISIAGGSDNISLNGVLLGISNVGRMIPVTADHTESRNVGHTWTGQLTGTMPSDHEDEPGSVILAEYFCNVIYVGQDRMDAVLEGTLEGVHVAHCEAN